MIIIFTEEEEVEKMPNIKSAKKKLRKDIKKTKRNNEYKNKIKLLTKKIKKEKKSTEIKDLIKKFYSLIDKAAKKNIFHKNKAARLKSKITKLVDSKR